MNNKALASLSDNPKNTPWTYVRAMTALAYSGCKLNDVNRVIEDEDGVNLFTYDYVKHHYHNAGEYALERISKRKRNGNSDNSQSATAGNGRTDPATQENRQGTQ